MSNTSREIGRFKACDEDGRLYVVIEYQTIISSDEVRRDAQSSAGRVTQDFKLEDGRSVIKIDAETFQIRASKTTIWKLGT
jgi:hypothetical protein